MLKAASVFKSLDDVDFKLWKSIRPEHPALVRGFGAGVDNARTMGHRRAISARRKGGEEFPAEASISKFGDGDAVTFNVVLRDVSERYAAQQQLEQLALRDGLTGLANRALLTDRLTTAIERLERRGGHHNYSN